MTYNLQRASILILSFLVIIPYAYACTDCPQEEINAFAQQSGTAIQGAQGASTTSSGMVMSSASSIQLPEGTAINNARDIEISTDGNIVRAEHMELDGDVMENVENFEPTEDGYTAERINRLITPDGTTLNGATGVIFSDGILTAEHADSFIKSGSATTNIKNLKSQQQIFSVQKADSLLSGCLRVDEIEYSEFKIWDKIQIIKSTNSKIKITDCSFRDSEFSGSGKVIIDKSENPSYTIENGTLKIQQDIYNETVQSEASAIVETDKTFGFKCMAITPAGTYFYSDADVRKDFSINIPKESSVYKLCLRKNQAQQFQAYNGMVDFVNKKIELNGIANYLRYPLKNSQISSLLSSFVYRGLKNVNALLSYDDDLLSLQKTTIKNTINNKNQITITKPNNFYAIEEIELDDGKVHRIVGLSLIAKEDATQSIISNYESDSLDADINIEDGILVQQIGESKVTILPPGHPLIIFFLR